MKNRHLVIVSYDGLFSYYTGVGTVIRNTMDILNEMSLEEHMKISLAGISLDIKGKAFDPPTYEKAKALVSKYHGSIISLANDTNGLSEDDLWKDPTNWRTACNSLVSSLNVVLDENDDNFIMLHDTVFLYFEIARRQIRYNLRGSIRAFYIPHSSGLNHTFTKDSWNKERIRFEKECFAAIAGAPQSKVVAIGKNFAQHLESRYGVSFGKGTALFNGLIFDKYKDVIGKFSRYDDIRGYAPSLKKDSKIIFSWGRLSQAKGFYELLETWSRIECDYPDYYLVLQAPMSCIAEKDFFDRFLNRLKEVPRVVHINEFSPLIWQSFLRYEKTRVVCFASTMDPNPFAPIEAKLFCKSMNYVIVASFKDGIKDSFAESECIPIMDPSDTHDFADKMRDAIQFDPEKISEMNEKNYYRVHSFDYKKNLIDFLFQNSIIS